GWRRSLPHRHGRGGRAVQARRGRAAGAARPEEIPLIPVSLPVPGRGVAQRPGGEGLVIRVRLNSLAVPTRLRPFGLNHPPRDGEGEGWCVSFLPTLWGGGSRSGWVARSEGRREGVGWRLW